MSNNLPKTAAEHIARNPLEEQPEMLSRWPRQAAFPLSYPVSRPRPSSYAQTSSFVPNNFISHHRYQTSALPLTSQLPSSHDRPVDLDLDLQSLWFVNGKFPPSTINTRTHSSTSGWESSGSRKKHYKVIHMRFPNLSSSKIRITWDSSNPGYTVKAEQRHTPPPRLLSRQELEDCRAKYSDSIAAWCESKMGQQVGNGECWTLANEALNAVAQQCTSRGQEPCTASQELVHGHILYTYRPAISPKPEPAGGIPAAGVARGDIIQILSARFESLNGSFQVAGRPDHTAVVTGVEPNGVLRVVQQNMGGFKTVGTGSYNMSELTTGEVRIFRAVGINWLGELKAEW